MIATLQGVEVVEVCGEAENGLEGVSQATKLKPDVVVLDITMPEMNGLEAAREICSFAPEIPASRDRVFFPEDLQRS